ncbi:hypothetical protein M422DRAFT_270721 [Sphaerobolus stellatus SS14]|uniref:Uncharacterized protein n=1 Tax=Sphaerobolus stellatus (strain SS14) TaxID=990650 RepID=A0A0C9TFC7_SPHS4|nr:hypothetical protein M422DRAFT_270721 [Sphaerobolus stellatus SS14]
MKSLSLFAIVNFALSFTAAAPLEPREPKTTALVQRETDTAEVSWPDKREVDTADVLNTFRWVEKREVEIADVFLASRRDDEQCILCHVFKK